MCKNKEKKTLRQIKETQEQVKIKKSVYETGGNYIRKLNQGQICMSCECQTENMRQ